MATRPYRPYNTQRHGEAEYNQHISIPSGDAPSGISRLVKDGQSTDIFAQMVYLVNASDISSGGGGTSGLSLESTQQEVLSALQNLDVSSTTTYVAVTGVPSAVGNGETVPAWADELGRQVIAGYNQVLDSLDANVINYPELNSLEGTDLDAVTTSGAGTEVDYSLYNKLTYQIISSGITSGQFDISIQHSLDGTNYADISTLSVTTNKVDEIAIENRKIKYVRANITNDTTNAGGAISVVHIAGR